MHITSTTVKTAFSDHLRTETSPCVLYSAPHSGENCSLDLSRRSNMLARGSQTFHREEKFAQDLAWNLNRPARASQDLHCGQNCFLVLDWYLKRPIRAPQCILPPLSKLLSPTISVMKQVSTWFTVPLQ